MKNSKKIFLVSILGALVFAIATMSSYALWSDSELAEGQIQTGRVQFDVGTPTSVLDTSTGRSDDVVFPVTLAHAEALVADGEIAVPVRVRSLSQGVRGLHYEVTVPTFDEDTAFGISNDVAFFPVASPADCTVANTPPQAADLESTPIDATYSSTEDLDEEYWCLTATYADGSYTNEATATGSVNGVEVTTTDSWSVGVTANLTPEANPNQNIIFDYTTFRPGVTP